MWAADVLSAEHMGLIYEILSTPVVYVQKALASTHGQSLDAVRVAYGEDSNQACVFYEPQEITHESTIVYFHGGGYLVGTPQSMATVAAVFNMHGYRFASVGFRLMGDGHFPAQVDDAFAGTSCVVDYLVKKGVSNPQIVMAGSSAGGHAAALVTYGRQLQREHGFDPAPIAGFISLAGVMDIDVMLNRALWLWGGSSRYADIEGMDRRNRESVHDALAPYSPIQLIDQPADVPMLVLHGRSDRMSPYDAQVRFVNKLNCNAGHELATLHTFESWPYQHIVLTAGLFSQDPKSSVGQKIIFDWLDEHGL